MTHPPYSLLERIDTLWIDPEVADHPLTASVMKRFPLEKIRMGIPSVSPQSSVPETLRSLKRRLLVTRYRGRLVKPCPGSQGRICCGYQVINAMIHCPMDCHYCILQTHLSVPALTLYVNEDQIREEITERLESNPEHIYRFGTGELGDSLVHDALTGFSRRMVPFFAESRNGILELKTKTAAIDTLRGLDPKEHTVISWSVNPPTLIRAVEPLTATLDRRLRAAHECQEMGYWIGLHFDPIIWFEGWEEAYRGVIEELARILDPTRILWISIAGLRYTRAQKDLIRMRFSDTPLFTGEFFRDEDGKFRYLQPLRISMYKTLLRWLREWSPDLFIYCCMENRRAWEATFPDPPRNTRELDGRFNENIWRHLRHGR